MSLSDRTVRSYLDILTGAFMVRQLQPWYEDIGKRQVKAPKVYLRDTGLFHSISDLKLDHLWVIYPGQQTYPAHERAAMLPLRALSSLRDSLV